MNLPKSLLTEEIVLQIKKDLFPGHMTQREISEKYSISQPTISRIYRGYEWKEIPWPDGSLGHIPTEIWKRNISSKRRNASLSSEKNRNAPSPIVHDVAKKVTSIIDALPKKDIQEILKSGEQEEHIPEKRAINLLPWKTIKELDPFHPTVLLLQEEENVHLKIAAQIIFYDLPVEKWQRSETLDLILLTADQLKTSAKQLKRKLKKGTDNDG